ncbi:unnamed protein product [Colias eurytheme]|nr:unnamed protein product [Colias eurytheme]
MPTSSNFMQKLQPWRIWHGRFAGSPARVIYEGVARPTPPHRDSAFPGRAPSPRPSRAPLPRRTDLLSRQHKPHFVRHAARCHYNATVLLAPVAAIVVAVALRDTPTSPLLPTL